MEEKRLNYALEKWADRKAILGKLGEELEEEICSYPEEEKNWLIYLMATLPMSDLANYPLSAWVPYIRHALMLRETFEWTRDLDEQTFTDYVFYPRINTEDIEECRQFFYGMLEPRIRGLNLEQAVIETNYWCQENVTYHMADDRTKSAITAYRSCGGRCGEESTFTVTALRAIGIPSRQVYAPWWSHCDDNHAWVEVLIDGKWHFMGACEAAPKYDTGWFTNAASRAMVVHARTFTGADNDGELKKLYGENAYRFHVENGVTYEHVTDLYALLTPLEITVNKEDGTPAVNALVKLEILNMAEMLSAGNIRTDEEGKVRVQLGRGQVRVHAILSEGEDTLMAEEDVVLGEEPAKATLVLHSEKKETAGNGTWNAFDFMAPVDYPMNPGLLTEEEKQVRTDKRKNGTELREKRIEDAYIADEADEYSPAVQKHLHEAVGNFSEIMTFLNRNTPADRKYREAMLDVISTKDQTDAKADVLEEHLICSLEYSGDFSEEVFVPYLMNPRVFNETMTPYRVFIQNFFDEKTQKAFIRKPALIWDWINENTRELPEKEYGDLFYVPAASLRSGLTTAKSRRILFVAICRTLGIPARLNPNSKDAEYYKNGKFISAEPSVTKNVLLTLTAGEDADAAKEWIDRQTFTLGRLEDGQYVRIDMPKVNEKGSFELWIQPGQYRLLTSTRLPNGHSYAYAYGFTAEEKKLGKTKLQIELQKRDARLTEILSRNAIVDFNLRTKEGEKVSAASLLQKKSNLFVWIEEGKEPTEHILNEMLAQEEDFRNFAGDILFILKSEEAKEQATLAKALKAFPNVRIYYDDFADNVNALARRMYVDTEKLPLVILMHDGLCGVYASSGYNVGLGDLLLKIVRAFES